MNYKGKKLIINIEILLSSYKNIGWRGNTESEPLRLIMMCHHLGYISALLTSTLVPCDWHLPIFNTESPINIDINRPDIFTRLSDLVSKTYWKYNDTFLTNFLQFKNV